ncbi:MAG: hypothetical protein JXD22_06360 [Sedimentisphaerales bacterium]|nr:hypothetical protein [Sedimentisphaerales bacterium]
MKLMKVLKEFNFSAKQAVLMIKVSMLVFTGFVGEILFRPFRALKNQRAITQGNALGFGILPLQGSFRETDFGSKQIFCERLP